MTEPLPQWQREILVGALLDVKFQRWGQWFLDRIDRGETDLPDGYAQILDPILISIRASQIAQHDGAEDPTTLLRSSLMFCKQIALMSDETLAWFVSELAEANPLKVDL